MKIFCSFYFDGSGTPGGVFFFFDGTAIGRRNSFIFMPKRIDLSPYFDKEFRRKELELFAELPEGLSPLEERLPADQEYLYKKGKPKIVSVIDKV